MGKLTVKELDDLSKSGILNNKTVKELQESGFASSRRRNTRRYMKTATGSWVSPQLYFQGRKGATPSKKMLEFRNDFNKLMDKYTTSKTTTK